VPACIPRCSDVAGWGDLLVAVAIAIAIADRQ
jgi:hypothetical protein